MQMKSVLIALALLAAAAGRAAAQPGYVPAPENIEARERFRDHRFGIFIHWGLYALLGDGEWAMHNKNIECGEYARLADAFCPSRFSAREWARAVREAGAGYLCFTSRHHDGFSLFDSDASGYNSADATPFARDAVGELAEACREQGLDLHLYYSHLDWSRSDYWPLGRTGHGTGRTGGGEWDSYLGFMESQLTELLTRYGPIGAIWFDGYWDRDEEPGGLEPERWNLYGQYELIHRLQPACLIGNNHHMNPFPGEDIQIFERDIPGENLYGYSEQDIGTLPLETCQTMNRSWGYRITDTDYKSTEELIRYLVRTAGMDANLLLNVGPRPDGSLPDQALERLRGMGRWLERYGESIRGTRGGVVAPHGWGVTTQRGNRLYVHVLDASDPRVFVPYGGNRLLSAVRMADGSAVRFTSTPEGVVLTLAGEPDPTDEIIVLTYKNEIE